MDQNNPNRMYAALGIAGQAGCLTVGLVIVALLVGLWLDQTLGTRRVMALVCVVVSAPLSLMLALWVTQRLISRVFPPPSTAVSPSQPTQQKHDIAEDEA